MGGTRFTGRVVAALRRARGLHSFRISSQQRLHLAAVLIALAAVPLHAQDIKFDPATTQAEFEKFSRIIAQGIFPDPVQPARVSGLLHFDAGIAATGVKIDTNSTWWKHAVTKDFSTHGYVGVPRLVISKGLGSATIFGSYAKVNSADIKTWGGGVDIPIIRGTLATPEIAVRGSYATLTGVQNYSQKVYGVEAFISKGIGPVTPYGAIGRMRSNATGTIVSTNPTFAAIPPLRDRSDVNRFTAGVRISLLVPKIGFEITKAEVTSYAAKVSIGF